MSTLTDVRHIALWPATNDTNNDIKTTARHLREHGFDVTVLDPRRYATNHDADLAVGLGDPAPAAAHARQASIPLLIGESCEHIIDALTGDLSRLTTRSHHLVQLRADRSRIRTVLADAHINVDVPGSRIHVEDRHRDHTGLTARVVTSDPLKIGDSSTPRPDRPVLRVERASGIWSEPIPLQRHHRLSVSARPAGKLHIDTDGGRHAGLAVTIEVGPVVTITIVESLV